MMYTRVTLTVMAKIFFSIFQLPPPNSIPFMKHSNYWKFYWNICIFTGSSMGWKVSYV